MFVLGPRLRTDHLTVPHGAYRPIGGDGERQDSESEKRPRSVERGGRDQGEIKDDKAKQNGTKNYKPIVRLRVLLQPTHSACVRGAGAAPEPRPPCNWCFACGASVHGL